MSFLRKKKIGKYNYWAVATNKRKYGTVVQRASYLGSVEKLPAIFCDPLIIEKFEIIRRMQARLRYHQTFPRRG